MSMLSPNVFLLWLGECWFYWLKHKGERTNLIETLATLYLIKWCMLYTDNTGCLGTALNSDYQR